MIKKIIFSLSTLCVVSLSLVADEIKMEHAKMMRLGDVVSTNAKITQLLNQQQEIVSVLGGHVEKYFVRQGEEIESGDKIALIESMKLSQMTAEYISLVKQIRASKVDLKTAQTLHNQIHGHL